MKIYSEHLQKLVATGQLKPSSIGWLTGSIDPFHDFSFDIEGLPDAFGGATVVQFVKQQLVVRAPAGLAPTDNWDVHIFTMPILDTETARSITYKPNFLGQDMTTAMALGTVTVNSGISGSVLLPDTTTWVAPTGFSSVARSPTDFGNSFSMMRLVGGGFEVHNNTEELHKKGSVTVYSQPQSLQIGQGAVQIEGLPDNQQVPSNWFVGRCPPQSLSQCVSNTNSRTWEAKEGCYVPFRIQADRGEYSLASSIPLVFPTVDNSADYASLYGGFCTECDVIVTTGLPETRYVRSDTPVRISNTNTVGAYFTGLGPETVLTLDIRFIVEIAPTPNNQTLISLASPSAAFDPIALELYTKALAELPPGIMVKYNANGKWWETVKTVLKQVQPVVSGLGPYGAIAAKAIDYVPAMESAVKSTAGLLRLAQNTRNAEKEKARTKPQRPVERKQKANKGKVKTD